MCDGEDSPPVPGRRRPEELLLAPGLTLPAVSGESTGGRTSSGGEGGRLRSRGLDAKSLAGRLAKIVENTKQAENVQVEQETRYPPTPLRAKPPSPLKMGGEGLLPHENRQLGVRFYHSNPLGC